MLNDAVEGGTEDRESHVLVLVLLITFCGFSLLFWASRFR